MAEATAAPPTESDCEAVDLVIFIDEESDLAAGRTVRELLVVTSATPVGTRSSTSKTHFQKESMMFQRSRFRSRTLLIGFLLLAAPAAFAGGGGGGPPLGDAAQPDCAVPDRSSCAVHFAQYLDGRRRRCWFSAAS